MASIDDIILRSANPFDNISSVNFWYEQQQPEPEVDSIHQEAITTIEATLDQVAEDHRTRTLILDGDGGSGKTYLLGRLKKAFNHKAFFAYIPPFPQSDHIWRHILRYTVDSLIQVPDGQTESQLLLWLNSILTSLKQRSLKDKITKDDVFDFVRNDRQKFIRQLKSIYKKAGIYNADYFFGVLHDLLEPELYDLACEWLRGDSLSEESLRELKVKSPIEEELDAREIIANFGRIAGDTQPIVICFDQLESLARLSDDSIDLQTLFNINTKIHGEDKNFLIIISISTNTWKRNESEIDLTHKARLNKKVDLKPITLEQAGTLLSSRLYSLHSQANPKPNSSLYPLNFQYLENEFPGAKVNVRESLILGRDIFKEYKQWLLAGEKQTFTPSNSTKPKTDNNSEFIAAFKLKWREEFTKTKQRISKVRYLSSPELIQMLQEALAALKMEKIKTPLLTGTKFASYSLSYQLPGKSQQLGVVWTEDSNMNTFFHIMEACGKEIKKNPSLTLTLIRAEGNGNSKNKGYRRYTELFTGSRHHHLIPDLSSVHYLATYYSLVKDAREGDLVIGGRNLGFKNLQTFIRELEILQNCLLLEKLGIFSNSSQTSSSNNQSVVTVIKSNNQSVVTEQKSSATKPEIVKPDKELKEAKEFFLNSIKMQQVMGKEHLTQNIFSQFPKIDLSQIEKMIQQLCQEKQIQIVGSPRKPEEQLICLVPKQ
ncbi:MAG: ATP-binding protein [Coleofasciculaceae cyanobacterium]